jgi:hypothetical protein
MQNDRRLQPYPRLGLTTADDGAANLPTFEYRCTIRIFLMVTPSPSTVKMRRRKKSWPIEQAMQPVVCAADQESMGG